MSSSSGRWWIYQKERFPLAAHGPLIAAFSFSALCYSTLLRSHAGLPATRAIVVAFFSSLLFFLELRIADEFKDYDEDARYRPYRPVPRGLVSLRELGALGGTAGTLQLLLAIWLDSRLALVLLGVWLYLGLMSKEFFVRRWLKTHPVTYLWTHMLIMPLVDFYVTACDWLPAVGRPPAGLGWFLVLSFFNGIGLEIGRKVRAPGDEETGVETYSFLWGRAIAARAWWGALAMTGFCGWMAARQVHFGNPAAGFLVPLLLVAGLVAARYLAQPATARARAIEAMSGLWTLLMYLGIGAIPRLLRL